MQFNPDPNLQANEVIFFRKLNSKHFSYPPIKFNNTYTFKCSHIKQQLGTLYDSKLNSSTHVDQKIKQFNKLIGLIRRLSVNCPRNELQYKNLLLDLI